MSPDFVIQVAERGVYMVLIVCGPLMLLALAVGLFVSILQATTQIQEQTLAFVPKLSLFSSVSFFRTVDAFAHDFVCIQYF